MLCEQGLYLWLAIGIVDLNRRENGKEADPGDDTKAHLTLVVDSDLGEENVVSFGVRVCDVTENEEGHVEQDTGRDISESQ